MLTFIFKILYTVTTFIQTLIVFRIILKVINADSANSLVSWVYNLSQNFITPFNGIVPEEMVIDKFSIELTPIVALVFFSIVGFVFSELTKAFKQAN
ncbi:MAG: YggT family protein [Candidatus Dojkabacteria bacterium]|nr:YggT family protein [Candidatus Dojkabacteria bacterium]